MRDARISRAPWVWLVPLTACALWLLVQNALVALALWWMRPAEVAAVAIALVKAGALVIAQFWGSPGAAVAAGMAWGLLVGVAAVQARKEARHG